MADGIRIIRSSKVGLDSKESFVIVRNRVSYLRILGEEPHWDLMTATASEDDARIHVCADQRRLVESALRLCGEYGGTPIVEKDWRGREYVKIGVITREPGESDWQFEDQNARLLNRFFEIFENYKS